MKNIKVIAMDFDGTLLTSDKIITNKTKECLLKYKNKSYKIIGVTARNLLSVKDIIDVSLFDYIILNNGSDIYYVSEDKTINVGNISHNVAKKIYLLCKDKSCQIDFCTPYKYLIKKDEKGDERSFIKYIDDFSDVNESISRMNVVFKESKDLEEYKILIEKSFDNLNVVRMIDTDLLNSLIWLTINPKNVNKLSSLIKICNDLKCTIDEVIFFGDGENDLVLIENAGIGVAMENAVDIVKEKAPYITLSNDNDGIRVFLENNL